MIYDYVIIGAGLYGLYSAHFLSKKSSNRKILVIEKDPAPFMRATYINQARVHMGYHYPRSLSTAKKSAHYFRRFNEDFGFSILTTFDQVYATSSQFSWTNAEQFIKFCKAADIRCDEISPDKYFNPGMCDGAFLTEEYTYDAKILLQYFLDRLKAYPNVEFRFNTNPVSIEKTRDCFNVTLSDGAKLKTGFLLNSSYASVNQINNMVGFDPFKLKYELCEIIICDVTEKLKDTGLTVMDGPFFSIMPFGKTGQHSLTSVTFTPHMACHEDLPYFSCMEKSNGYCSSAELGNCNECIVKPESAWPYMSVLAKKYMKEEYEFGYKYSLFSMKPILRASEIDDSRPTVIRKFSDTPAYIAVLSGKINTVYDLDEVLDDV